MADRHTAQLKQLVNLATQQSGNTQFILQELIQMKTELGELKVQSRESKEKQNAMDTKLDRILGLLDAGK